MNKNLISARFFAKADGQTLGWRDRLAKLKGFKAKPKATAKLEVDDANGEKMIFPEIGDVSEIKEGVAVTATDGTHVFVADTTTYTCEVLNGKIVSVVETPTAEEEQEAEAMNEDTQAFVEAVAQELEANETFRTSAQAEIDELKTQLATAAQSIKDLKALMKHGGDDTDDGKGGKKPAAGGLKIGGKSINLDKINLK